MKKQWRQEENGGNRKEKDAKSGGRIMIYRELGKTGLMVSEIGLGGEWLERHNTEEVKAVIDVCEEEGINILVQHCLNISD